MLIFDWDVHHGQGTQELFLVLVIVMNMKTKDEEIGRHHPCKPCRDDARQPFPTSFLGSSSVAVHAWNSHAAGALLDGGRDAGRSTLCYVISMLIYIGWILSSRESLSSRIVKVHQLCEHIGVRNSLLFKVVSAHRRGRGFYPCSGDADEVLHEEFTRLAQNSLNYIDIT